MGNFLANPFQPIVPIDPIMAAKPKVYVTDFIAEPCEIERRILGDIAEVVALDVTEEMSQ